MVTPLGKSWERAEKADENIFSGIPGSDPLQQSFILLGCLVFPMASDNSVKEEIDL
jgi:hypothetical protein